MANELQDLTAEFQSYIVSPLNAFGLGGFVFDIEGEAHAKLQAEITDHFTEDNKAVQDHIARKPKTIILRGYVGELTYKPQGSGVGGIIQQVTQKLTQVGAFLPTLTTAATQAQSIITNGKVGFNEALSDSANIYGLVQNIIGSTGDMKNQQQAYLYFAACWEQGVLMGIQTPWEFLTNMAIESVVAIQDEKTKTMTDFSVTYKQMRFAKTTTAAYSPAATTTASGSGLIGGISTSVSNFANNITDSVNNLATSAEEKVLQGVSALQGLNPVSIGPVPGVFLPSNLLPGAQSAISAATDMGTNSSIAGIFIDGPAPPLR